MRNLVVLEDRCTAVPLLEGSLTNSYDRVTAFCLDGDTGRAFFATAAGSLVCLSEKGQEAWRATLCREGVSKAGPDSGHACLCFALELECVCAGLAGGQLLLVSGESGDVEEVGHLEGGVVAMAWSPEGQLLTAVTGQGCLLLMTQDWEVVAEAALNQELQDNTAVVVAETQELLQGSVALSWRGDGQYFATVCPSSPGVGPGGEAAGAAPPQQLRIWGRDGCVLHAVAEAGNGPLLPALAWQPNGRHLFAAEQVPAAGEQPRLCVRLIERNGLGHGSFRVDAPACSTATVQSLAWSSNSQVLAIVLGPPRDAAGGRRRSTWRLQLWTRSNWKWYLKQELEWRDCEQLLVSWDEVRPLKLHAVTAGGEYRIVEMMEDASVSRRGTACVIDGRNVRITALRHARPPPPMCSAVLTLPRPAQSVAICDAGGQETLAAVMSDGRIAVAQSVEEDLWEETVEERLYSAAAAESQHPPAAGDGTSGLESLELPAAALAWQQPLADGVRVRSLCWIAPERLLLVASEPVEGSGQGWAPSTLLLEVTVCLDSGSADQVDAMRAPAAVLRVVGYSGGSGALVQLQGGDVRRYAAGGTLQPLSAAHRLPQSCWRLWPTPAAAMLRPGGDSIRPVLGLSEEGLLFWGDLLLASDCTSAVVRDDGPGGAFLLFTTGSGLMRIFSFSELPALAAQAAARRGAAPAGGGDGGDAATPWGLGHNRRGGSNMYRQMHTAMRPSAAIIGAVDASERAVEAGAWLVAAPPHQELVVMQLPRGNLEGVRPRRLVLAAVAEALEQKRLRDAWGLAATDRLDLNVLVDYAWPATLLDAAELVAQVGDGAAVCDLLQALRPGSVVGAGGRYAGMDAACAPDRGSGARRAAALADPGVQALLPGGKVAACCRALRAAMVDLDPAQHLLPIVTSFERDDPADLEGALRVIRKAKEQEIASGTARTASAPSADDAMRHLLLTQDVDALYRTALGMYHLDLAYMVISHSQRDPGEFLYQLQQFAAYPTPALQHHAIDLHLRRFRKAMQHLLDEGGQDRQQQALQLATQQGLLRELLHMLPRDCGFRPRVMHALAEAMVEKGKWEDAAVAFLAAHAPEEALQAYLQSDQWRMALPLAQRLGRTPQQIRSMSRNLVQSLTGSGSYAAAAEVTLHYLQDPEAAVALFAQGKAWRDALRVAYQHSREDLLPTSLAPMAAEAAAATLDSLQEDRTRLERYWARLREVRQRRLAMQSAVAVQAAGEASGDAAPADWDAASDSVSVLSGMSAYTDRTAATTGTATSLSTVGGRTAQRKKKKKSRKDGGKIRQGSPEEEAQLLAHLAQLLPHEVECLQVGEMAELLVLLSHESDAALLQEKLGGLIDAAASVLQDVAEHMPEDSAPKEQPPKALGPNSSSPDSALRAALLAAQQKLHRTLAARWKWDCLRQLKPPAAAGSDAGV